MSLTDTVVGLAARGDGITASGKFVAGAAPGDQVLEDGAVVAGPHRQLPPCRHFGRCGGCQLQHVDDAAYAEFVRDRVVSALAAQSLEAEVRSPHLSPAHSRRRVALKGLRQGKAVLLGFSEGKSHRIVDLLQCEIMAEPLFAMIGPLRGLFGNLLSGRLGADVRMTLCDQGVDLLISGVEPEGLMQTEALNAFAATHSLARLSIDQGFGPEAWWEPEPATITLGSVAVGLPEGAFLQATADGEAKLVESVRSAVGAAGNVADLFAGLGTFALSLPGRVLAIEGSRDAILSLQTAAQRSGRTLVAEHRDLFRRPLAVAELARFEAVVLDPPRAGAKEQVGELARSAVPAIAYVSCNPGTFARDARTLVDGGYRLEWIQPVGQFRWSTHVELAAAFSR